jgi:ferric-dicitrate binding protein FerR (iron transport regulator)
MSKHPKHITDSLLLDYITGSIPPDELVHVEQWLEADPGNRKHLDMIRKIWEHSSSFPSFDQIDMQKDWQVVSNRIGGGKTIAVKPKSRSVIYTITRIAAIAIILTGLGYMLYFLAGEPVILNRQLVVHTTDQKSTIDLPDGSRVYLNKGSSLHYPARFRSRLRRVDLMGEAWFEVAENRKKPFIVSSDGAEIKVLGTSFNIMADPQADRIIVSVVEGKVSFYPKDNEREAILLTVHEEGIFVADSIYKHTVTNLNFISWKTGILNFDKTPLKDVMRSIEKHYQVPVFIEGNDLQNKTLTSVYDNQSLEEVLGELNLLLGITHHFKNDTLVIKMD